MDSGHRFLRFSDEVAPVTFNEVGITHPNGGVVVVQQDLRLRPMNRAIFLKAAGNPARVAVAVVASGHRRPLPRVSRLTSLIVVPLKILTVAHLPDEVRRTRLLDALSARRVSPILRRRPVAPAIAAVGVTVIAVDSTVRGI